MSHMKTLIIALFATVVLATGCARYASYIRSDTFGELRLPKDAAWDSLIFSKLPDGTVELEIKNATFSMNPAVIDAETAQLVAMMQQIYQAGLAAGKMMPGVP